MHILKFILGVIQPEKLQGRGLPKSIRITLTIFQEGLTYFSILSPNHLY